MRSDRRLIGLSILTGIGLSAAAVQAAPVPTPVPPSVPPVITVAVPPSPPAPPPRPIRSSPSAAVPLFDLAYLITAKDYPPEARRKRRAGEVAFMAVVNKEGRASNCLVMQSTAHALLKQATCDLVIERAQFEPAINAEGKPVFGMYTGQINWDLSKSLDTPLPGTITRQFVVDADGKVIRCRITKVTGAAARQYKVGAEPCRYTEFLRDYESAAERKRKVVTEVDTVAVSEVPSQP
jgi:TonB family protein